MLSKTVFSKLGLQTVSHAHRYKLVGVVQIKVPGQPRPKRTGKAGYFKRGSKIIPTIKKHEKNEEAEKKIQEAFFATFAALPEEVQILITGAPWKGPFCYAHQYFFKMTGVEKGAYKGHDIIRKQSKPDVENLNKMANDALEGYVMLNDCAAPIGYGEKWAMRNGEEYSLLTYGLLEEV